MDDPTGPVKRVFNAVVQNTDVHIEDVPDYNSVRSRLKRCRQKALPPIPHTVEEVNVEGEWERSWRGHQLKSYQDNDWGILLFATLANYSTLSRSRVIYIDGTFKTCPAPYSQFVTIHGLYHGHVLPFVMCLMSSKQVGHYRQMLQHVKREVRRITGHRFRPQKVICDFEQALIIAVETELRGVHVSGCYFHFTQSLWRHIQELGLTRPYRHRRSVQKFLRKLLALGYLPLALVRQNFNILVEDYRTARLIRRYPALQDFILYVRRNYMDGNFPPRMWNVFDRDTDTRTNNHVEGNVTQYTTVHLEEYTTEVIV